MKRFCNNGNPVYGKLYVKTPRDAEISPSNWLEHYPPDQSQIDKKDKLRPPPVSESRSKWLNKKPQDTLDLHGMTEQEGKEALARFIQSMIRRGLRKGLVIHGKGLHSSDASILAPMVRQFLESSKKVGQFGHPNNRDGGKGATWFILCQY